MEGMILPSLKKGDSSFEEVLTTTGKDINQFMRVGNADKTNRMFSYIFNCILPKYSDYRILKNDWGLHTSLKFIQYEICLFALAQSPFRCLAVVMKTAEGNEARRVLDNFQFTLIKITTKTSKRKNNIQSVIINQQTSSKLITTRRGYFVPNLTVHNMKLSAVMENGRLQFREEQVSKINEIYYKYVYGMDRRPSEHFKRKKEDFGFEQFLLDEYPTPEWKNHIFSLPKEKEEKIKNKSTSSTSKESPDDFVTDYVPSNISTDICNGHYIDLDEFEEVQPTKKKMKLLHDFDLNLDSEIKIIEQDRGDYNFDSLFLDMGIVLNGREETEQLSC